MLGIHEHFQYLGNSFTEAGNTFWKVFLLEKLSFRWVIYSPSQLINLFVSWHFIIPLILWFSLKKDCVWWLSRCYLQGYRTHDFYKKWLTLINLRPNLNSNVTKSRICSSLITSICKSPFPLVYQPVITGKIIDESRKRARWIAGFWKLNRLPDV